MNYRYTLDRSNRKHICPACGKRRFVRFVDTLSGEYMPDEYGRCDREINCGYFQKPDYSTMAKDAGNDFLPSRIIQPVKNTVRPEPVFIPYEVLQRSRTGYELNTFVAYLLLLFGPEITKELIQRYHIGTSCSRWPGATVFWFIDIAGRVRAGQVKQFDYTGHTVKTDSTSHTTWIHSILKYNYGIKQIALPDWLSLYLAQGGNYVNCLYGEHLLTQFPGKPVAIVEAPATAIVASVYLPEYIWLATGSLSYLTTDRCKVLSGRQVCLFPDLSTNGRAFELWKRKAKELAGIASITVSDLLERHATVEEMLNGLDLRDFLTRYDYKQFNYQPNLPKDDPVKYLLTIDNRQFEIKEIVSVSEPGNQFDNIKIACFQLTQPDICEILFSSSDDLISPFCDYLKREALTGFRPAKLNDSDCLVRLLKHELKEL